MFQTFDANGYTQIPPNNKVIVSGPESTHTGVEMSSYGGVRIITNAGTHLCGGVALELDPRKAYWLRFNGDGYATCNQNLYVNKNILYISVGASVTLREANNSTYEHTSGYLDVFDSSGNLTWSASGTKNTCDVLQYNNFTVNEACNGQANVVIGGNPWIYLNPFQSCMWFNQSVFTNSSRGVILRKSGDTYSAFAGWGLGQTSKDYIPQQGGNFLTMIFGKHY